MARSHSYNTCMMAFLGLLAVVTVASADVVTTNVFIQDLEITTNGVGIGQVYLGTHDAELRKDGPNANYNEGTGDTNGEFTVDGMGFADESHVVFRFDDIFDHVPSNAIITNATLFIDIDNQGDDMSMYRIAESVPAWLETNVTWNNLGSVSNGVDVGTDTIGTATIIDGQGNKVLIDVTADVQAWFGGATNNGWAFMPGGDNGVDFDASENLDKGEPEDRPALTIVHVVVNTNTVQFTQDPITGGSATATVAYAGSIAGYASDPDSDPLTFSKVSGPLWLNVSSNGTLSGTPTLADMGTGTFIVKVSDSDDGSDTATLNILVNDQDGSPPPDPSSTEHYRIIWDDDPSSTATIAWKQISGANGTVFYGSEDFGRAYSNYPSQKTVDSVGAYRGGQINTCFARISGLNPDTAYYFVIKDDAGVSPRYWFLTASDSQKAFTFIAGGDSRTNHKPRREANRLVAKLRPLFVVFTGDMIETDDAASWNTWFEHWQETISGDGRMYPLIPHRGNHENAGNNDFFQLFDTTAENYYAFSVAGDLLRFYVLNSETTEGGDQAAWLGDDMATNSASHTHLAAGYHKPMCPHVTWKSEGEAEYNAWAQLFYDYSMDVVFEADSHTAKRTWPIRPDTGAGSDHGFIRDDTNGTVYAGEGCWGAPLRDANDTKDWTRAAEKLYSFNWVHVYPSYMELFTVKVDNADATGDLQEGDVFSLPPGIDLWAPSNGTRVVINNQGTIELESYAQWQLDQWGTNTTPANSEALADFDGDGYNNMTEFAYGLDPKVVASPGNSVFPVISLEGSDIEVSYRRRKNTSLTYHYDFSGDLIQRFSF